MKVVREIVPREKIDMIKNLLESIADDCNINTVVETNSVCEWTLDDSFKIATSNCGSIDTHRIDFKKFKYCPYCGKKLLTN